MRSPFQLPSNCEPVSFNISIVPSVLPVCSLPPFTDADLRPMDEVFVSVPFAIPPDPCFTVPPYTAHVTQSPKRTISRLRVSMRVQQKTPLNPCDPSYNLSLLVSMPCLPISVSSSTKIELVPQLQPSLHVNMSRLSKCTLKTGVDIAIPCVGFTPVFSVFIYNTDCGLSAVALPDVTISGCEVHFKLDLFLPSCGCQQFTYIKEFNSAGEGGNRISMKVWRQRADCVHEFVKTSVIAY